MSFQRDIAKFRIGSIGKASEVRTNATLALFAGTIKSTPVGNPDLWDMSPEARASVIASGYKGGSLRAAWVLTNRRADKGVPFSRTPVSSNDIINLAQNGQDVYLANNLPYARRVEYGWSRKQAPAGMVRVNFRRIKKAIRIAVFKTQVKKLL